MAAHAGRLDSPILLKMLAHDLRWAAVMALARGDYRVQELVAMLGESQNLVSYHLKRLRDADLVHERRSSADARDVYYSLDLPAVRDLLFSTGEAIHPGLGAGQAGEAEAHAPMKGKPARVLFLCTYNSARSQMAEGIMRHLGGDLVEVYSAGTAPSQVRPEALEVLSALGIDISAQRSKHLDEFRDQSFDYVVTVCDRARESCPVFPGDPEQIHWSFPDPSAIEGETERLQAFTQTAQELMRRLRFLLAIIEKEQREKEKQSG